MRIIWMVPLQLRHWSFDQLYWSRLRRHQRRPRWLYTFWLQSVFIYMHSYIHFGFSSNSFNFALFFTFEIAIVRFCISALIEFFLDFERFLDIAFQQCVADLFVSIAWLGFNWGFLISSCICCTLASAFALFCNVSSFWGYLLILVQSTTREFSPATPINTFSAVSSARKAGSVTLISHRCCLLPFLFLSVFHRHFWPRPTYCHVL